MLKNRYNNNAASIKEAIINDRLVIFAGAGVSKDSGIPLWHELEKGIKNRLNEYTSETDALKIAQMLYNEKGEKEYNDILKELLFKNTTRHNLLHEILLDINPQHIITTNYDHYFENVIKDEGLPFSIVSKDEDLPYAKHKKLLIKYHGDFENHNIVLKENDYLEFSQNNTLKEVFVKSLFSNKTILFVGYSVSDPNLKLLIRDIQHILKKHYQRAYLITAKNEVSDSEVKYFENLGINIVFQDSESIIKDETIEKRLSDIGFNIYNQLKYIKDFKLYEYRSFLDNDSSKIKTINELYNSLSRFHYIRVLPQNTLARLFPICKNSKQEAVHLINGATLKCFNDELYNLIADFKGKDDENYSKDEKEKLNYSLSRIVFSGVYSIGKPGKIDSFGNYSVKDEIDITTKITVDPNCECIDCLIDKYDYSNAIKKIFKYDINDNSELWEDLVYAYNLFRVCDFYTCYFALNKIITKSNRLNRLEVSFLAKYNLKRLKWAIRNDFYNDKINWDDIQKVNEEIDKIDLDDELDKVKYFVDEDVYLLLKEIRDGIYIQRLCNEIDEIFVKVPKTVENIKNGGSESSNVFNNLYRTVKKLKSFLQDNFIIGNGFSPVEVTLNKSINTFILGYYLKSFADKQYNKLFGLSHIGEFDTFLFKLIIEDSKPKELLKFLKKNEINNIKIAKGSIGRIILWINNFLKSSYKIPMHFSNEAKKNTSFINVVEGNELFENDLIRIFNSICLVVAYFDFSKEQFKTIYKNINHYIDFMPFNIQDYYGLEKIIINRHDDLDSEELEESLRIFNKKNYINNSYNLILEALIKKNRAFKNTGINLNKYEIESHSYRFTIIYKTLPIEMKSKFKSLLTAKLDEEKDTQIFYLSIREKILNTKKIKEQYKKIILRKLKLEFDDSTPNVKWILFPILQFYDLAYKGIIQTNDINVSEITEPKFKFLHNPEKFKKDEFDVNWLFEFNWESFCKRFSKINYIINSLENELLKKHDEKLSEIYFNIRSFGSKN
ncbi:SIR2 family protein [Mariniflexile sp. HMF6888]|uniref:SIR2 family protein n=1 Tax=Mariniflexile sp. HMF6888 TaxID=3373086 RepID=UPI003787DDA1